jgi:hypothetical protein
VLAPDDEPTSDDELAPDDEPAPDDELAPDDEPAPDDELAPDPEEPEELTFGLSVVLPADDDGVLVALVAFALADDDALVFGLAEDVAEGLDEGVPEADVAAAEAAACAEAGLVVQFGCRLGRTDPLVVVGLGLLLGVWVADGLLVGLGLLLGLLLADCVPVVVGLGLLLALALELAVLSLLWLPLDDVAGAVVAWVALLGEVLVVCVADGRAEDDVQDVAAGTGTPVTLAPPGEGAGVLLELSVPLVPLPELPLKAWLTALKPCAIIWRAGGTTDRTTPKANTATPMAKAGRSMASRQSLGRFGGRCGAGFVCSSSRAGSMCRPRSPRRRQKPAAKPAMASQRPSAPVGRLARAGRDRILSRIRCRPSVAGSTWSAAACSSRRKNSAKSCPFLPSKPRPGLTMNPAPAPRAARPCRVRCGS